MLILVSLPKIVAATFIVSAIFIVSVEGSSSNDCDCSRNFKPVCGSDEATYENLCKLTCEQRLRPALKLAYSGTCCPKAEFCTTFSDPICDNLGETHENECIFSYKQCVSKRSHNVLLKIEKRGSCELEKRKEIINRQPLLDCNFYCDESEELVCDNMGHTHKNLCKFELAKCRRVNRGLEASEIVKAGECEKLAIRRLPSSTMPTTPSAMDLKAKAWNYGTFAPPSPAPTVASPSDIIDSYGFGPIGPSSTSNTAFKASTTPKTTLPSATTYRAITKPPLSNTEAGTFPPSLQPDRTFTPSSSTSASTFPSLIPTSSEPSLFKNCTTCESEIEQVPICDNLNQTHKSICNFSRWNCKKRMSGLEERVLVHIGNCTSQSPIFSMEEEVCPSKCSKHYKPVCDTNGMTHPNLCTFQMFNCQQRKSGNIKVAWLSFLQECPPSTAATSTPKSKNANSFDCPIPQCPQNTNEIICDNEGNTHANDCEFAHARCLAAKRGVILRILPEESCTKASLCFNTTSEVCTSEIDPICATDFITYQNMCHFRKSQCKSEEEIEVLFKGECLKCLNTPCPIIDPLNASLEDSKFLCDQNGETKSRCEFEMLRCIYEIKFGYNITEAYDGRCCPRDEICPIHRETVCGSNNQNYRNRCFFNVAKCRAEKIEHELLDEIDCPMSIKMLESSLNCQEKGIICSSEYDPVCGSDGITYTNLCNFQRRTCNSNKNGPKIEIEYHGACCEEKCSAVDFSPVCDSQNVTHLNICEFGKERCLAMKKEKRKDMTIISYNVCDQLPCTVNCPAVYEPVCGSNGETFSSECELARSVCILSNAGETTLSIDYPGICCQKAMCDLTFEPICDSQGRTHVNECVFQQEACLSEKKNGLNLTIEHRGECCNNFCEANATDTQPICDSNGNTHSSLCEFQIQKCEAEKTGVLLNVAYMGKCCSLPSETCQNSTAVCDSDGMSHVNMCEYDYKKCVIEKTQPKLLSIIHSGECCLLDKCVDENQPICDSRGVTHLSLCHFNNSKCVYEKVHGINNGNLSFSYKGKCCEADCNNFLEPVCDQNGDIYRNKCIFEHRLCELSRREPDKEKLYLIPCKKRVRA